MGPLARYNLNFDRLTPSIQDAAREAGLDRVCRNPYHSIVVRSIEILYSCHEALRLIETYQKPDCAFVSTEPRAGTGYGCTEAPRGMLYHRYELGDDGTIVDARIVPPTSQNQRSIEEDLKEFTEGWLHLSDAQLRGRCEHSVRNHDPCISCATHFLKLDIDRDVET